MSAYITQDCKTLPKATEMNRSSILDCTLRDGGFSVNFNFSKKVIRKTIKRLIDANIELIEIGFLQSKIKYKEDYTLFSSIEDISGIMAGIDKRNTKIVAFLQYPDFKIDKIPQNNNTIDLIRIAPRYSELEKSLDFMKMVSLKGYNISIQPAVTARYTKEQLDMCIKTANEINAFSLYIVDTFGFLDEVDIRKYVDYYSKFLKEDIRIGFHGHNNTNQAYVNSKLFQDYIQKNYPNRKIIIDSTLTGIGRGAGNTQTELIAPWLNEKSQKYDICKLFDGCERIEKYNNSLLWGYSIVDMVSALAKVHYEYSNYYRKNYSLKYSEIFKLCNSIPKNTDLPYRFTRENAEYILANYQDK